MLARHVERELSLYCLGELAPPSASRVAEHLLHCVRCRRELEPIRKGVAWARTLTPVEAAGPSWQEIESRLDSAPRAARVSWPLWAVAAAAALLVAAGALWLRRPHVSVSAARGPLSEIEAAARAVYLEAPGAQLETDDPAELRSWVSRQTGLHISLALDGPVRAQVLALAAGPAVAVSYQMGGQPVTLVAAGVRTLGAAAPAEGLLRKRITFRRDADANLKLLSWTRKDQSYALVSALPNLGQQACFICHADPGRRQLIASLQAPL